MRRFGEFKTCPGSGISAYLCKERMLAADLVVLREPLVKRQAFASVFPPSSCLATGTSRASRAAALVLRPLHTCLPWPLSAHGPTSLALCVFALLCSASHTHTHALASNNAHKHTWCTTRFAYAQWSVSSPGCMMPIPAFFVGTELPLPPLLSPPRPRLGHSGCRLILERPAA